MFAARAAFMTGGKLAAPDPVTSGLFLRLDADNSTSYPGSGTTWFDLSGGSRNFQVSASSFTTYSGVKCFDFNGSYQSATIASGSSISPGTNPTIMVFSTINNNSNFRTLIRAQVSLHQILAWNDNRLGVYKPATNLVSTGYTVSSIPNSSTQFNCLTWRLGQSTGTYKLSVNGSTTADSFDHAPANFENSIYYIGGIEGNGQGWGKIAMVLIYNRTLSDAEIDQNYAAYKSRFSLP
jgi:hypothetical protein